MNALWPPLLFTWRHFLDVIPYSRHLGRYHAGFWAIHAYFEGLGNPTVPARPPESKSSWIQKSSSFPPRKMLSLSEFWWVPRRMAQCGGSSAQKQTPPTALNHATDNDQVLHGRYDPRNRRPDAWKGYWVHWNLAYKINKDINPWFFNGFWVGFFFICTQTGDSLLTVKETHSTVNTKARDLQASGWGRAGLHGMAWRTAPKTRFFMGYWRLPVCSGTVTRGLY